MAEQRGLRLTTVTLNDGRPIKIYAGTKVAKALDEVTADMGLYHGVRFLEVVEAVYEQGLKNGRAEIFKELTALQSRADLPHRAPGRPRKSKTAKKTTAKKTTAKKPTAK